MSLAGVCAWHGYSHPCPICTDTRYAQPSNAIPAPSAPPAEPVTTDDLDLERIKARNRVFMLPHADEDALVAEVERLTAELLDVTAREDEALTEEIARLTGLLSRIASSASRYDQRVYGLSEDGIALQAYLTDADLAISAERPGEMTARLVAQRNAAQARVTVLEAQRTAALGMHRRSRHNDVTCSEGCGTYPCATVRALTTDPTGGSS